MLRVVGEAALLVCVHWVASQDKQKVMLDRREKI